MVQGGKCSRSSTKSVSFAPSTGTSERTSGGIEMTVKLFEVSSFYQFYTNFTLDSGFEACNEMNINNRI